jgi:hypothetical protein
VLAIDVRLDWISKYLAQQNISQNGVIYVVTQTGDLIGYPHLYENETFTQLENIHSLPLAWVAKSFDVYKKTKEPSFSFEFQGQRYLAAFNSFPEAPESYEDPWIVGVVAPENDLLAD